MMGSIQLTRVWGLVVADDDLGITYDEPPVVEVVAATSFTRLPDVALPLFGSLWESAWSEEFPKVEQQPPYVAPAERFGQEMLSPRLSLQLSGNFPSPRYWFLSSEGSELLQLQQDWFACNWRKVEPGGRYDRWPSRRAAFDHWYRSLDGYLTEKGIGPLRPTQCEVTYINHVYPNSEWKDHSELSRIIHLAGAAPAEMPAPIEQGSLNYQCLLKDENGLSYGRLHIAAQPAFARDGSTPIYVIELTARGGPPTSDVDGVLAFLNKGREVIVRAFETVMTPSMQREWGRHGS